MLSVTRGSLSDKRGRMASSCQPSVLCTHVPACIISGPGIHHPFPLTSLSTREASAFCFPHSLLPAGRLSLIWRVLLISLVKWILREGEKERKGGTISPFGSHSLQFKGQMTDNSTEGQESFTLAVLQPIFDILTMWLKWMIPFL